MKKLIITALITLASVNAYSCITCNKAIQDGIYNSTFYPNLLVMLSAFIVIGIVVFILTRLATSYDTRRLRSMGEEGLVSVPLLAASAVLGIGLGGFADGIVLHQILQWHEMLTNKIPADTLVNKSINMFWDGIFHFYTLITTLIGVILMWNLLQKRNINRSGYLLSGGLLLGWGIFNLIEGIIDHHLLGLHNVREYSPDKLLWNYSFLGFGALLILSGLIFWKKAERNPKGLAV